MTHVSQQDDNAQLQLTQDEINNFIFESARPPLSGLYLDDPVPDETHLNGLYLKPLFDGIVPFRYPLDSYCRVDWRLSSRGLERARVRIRMAKSQAAEESQRDVEGGSELMLQIPIPTLEHYKQEVWPNA